MHDIVDLYPWIIRGECRLWFVFIVRVSPNLLEDIDRGAAWLSIQVSCQNSRVGAGTKHFIDLLSLCYPVSFRIKMIEVGSYKCHGISRGQYHNCFEGSPGFISRSIR